MKQTVWFTYKTKKKKKIKVQEMSSSRIRSHYIYV